MSASWWGDLDRNPSTPEEVAEWFAVCCDSDFQRRMYAGRAKALVDTVDGVTWAAWWDGETPRAERVTL
jgi:hypothetical protein